MKHRPNIIISAGRRLEYFKDTIASFAYHNYLEDYGQVYILDDRSTDTDRMESLRFARLFFHHKVHLMTFDNDGHFEYVEKFNMIKNLMGDSDFVFLLEDDWRSLKSLDIAKHIDYLYQNPKVDQIMFSQRFDIQWYETQAKTNLNAEYWSNPFPNSYKHFYEIRNGFNMWQEVVMDNYGNNPSIFRRRVFEDKYFIKDHGWEMDFADRYAGRTQILTKENAFQHIGINSLIDIIPKP